MVSLFGLDAISVRDRYKLGYTDSSCHPKCHPFAHCCYIDSYCNCYPGAAHANANSASAYPNTAGVPSPGSPIQR